MASNPIDDHFRVYSSAIAVVRACNHCKHTERITCGIRGAGRGYGMREGNKARGRMIQHIKAEHPEVLDLKP